MDNNYLYAVANIRANELSLLSRADIDALIDAPDYKTALTLLDGKGYDTSFGSDYSAMLDGETEKTFPFTEEKWPLLDSETMKEERITQEEGGIYVSKFTLNEPKHKIFEAGYEESEVDLRVEFELQADGKWYVVDCYTGWYGYDLPIGELKQTIQNVKEENAAFKELHP